MGRLEAAGLAASTLNRGAARRRRWPIPITALFCCGIGLAAPTDAADFRRTLFVAGRDSTALAAIDIDANEVVGRIELGLAPRFIRVSERSAKLVASDGRERRIAVADLMSGEVRHAPLSLAPSRLRISPDGSKLAAIDNETGGIALVDLRLVREKARLNGPVQIRDALFAADGRSLLIAADAVRGISIYDTDTGELSGTIDGPPTIALVRAPNGREGFAVSAEPDRVIFSLNLKSPGVQGAIPGPGAAGLFPTGSGRYLMITDPVGKKLSVAPAQPLERATTLAAAPGIVAAYSAWFDTVAFVPSGVARKVLVYDLDAGKADGAIAIGGSPGLGAVSPDGDRLFLPVEESREVVVIDAQTRRRVASIAVPLAPIEAVIVGGYGLCH